MSEKNTWAKRIVDRINPHVDDKFEEYRKEVASDLARGVAESASLLVTLASISLVLVFSGLALGLFLGWLVQSLALGMLIVSLVFVGIFIYIFFAGRELVRQKVLKDISDSLRIPEKENLQ